MKTTNSTDITTFLHKFVLKHHRLEFEAQIRTELNKIYVNSVNDLITLPAHSWTSLEASHSLGPVITPLLKKDVEQMRQSSKSNSKNNKKKSFAETQADIHKIKRFLFYETKVKKDDKELIEGIPYLSRNALKLGFEEQKKEKFDGGPVLDPIKSYLEDNFATANLSDLVKPSHGMILVSFYHFLLLNYF